MTTIPLFGEFQLLPNFQEERRFSQIGDFVNSARKTMSN
jgi:hypothetical protein